LIHVQTVAEAPAEGVLHAEQGTGRAVCNLEVAHARHAVDAGVPVNGARYALAGAMLTSGDTAGSAALLRTFSPAATDGADSCYQVGLLALEAGAPEVAERYLTRALALRPGWPQARQALDQARRR
jgi:hypothetical protein